MWLRKCLLGEEQELDRCARCKTGFFSQQLVGGDPICIPCLPNAECPNNYLETASNVSVPGMLLPKQGYWMSQPFSGEVHACVNPNACTYSNRCEHNKTQCLQVCCLAWGDG